MILIPRSDATAFAIGALGKGRRRVNSFASEVDEGGYTDPPATYSVHGDMRTIIAESKMSIHPVTGVVSTAAGRLYGFLVVSAGTGSTSMTVHDNASAGSGTVLRSVIAAELVRGAWVYCGSTGLVASNGIHVTLAGTTKPIVLAVFEGEYPTIAHSGTLIHIDGTDGNDAWDGTTEAFVSGTTGPRRSWTTAYNSGDWHLKLKRGTTIDITDSSVNMTGTDWLVEDYGDPEAAKPVLQQSAAKTSPFAFTAGAAGVIEVRNVRLVSLASGRKNGGGWTIREARAVLRGCESHNFTDGIGIGGSYSVVDDCTVTGSVNAGPDGDNDYAAPNYSLFMNSDMTADADVYSLHNGTGTGTGNVCIGTVLTVDPASPSGTAENCADINTQFAETMIAFCTINGNNVNTAKAIGADDDADGVALIANLVNCGSAAGIQVRSPNWTLTGNVVKTVGTTIYGAACVVFDQGNSGGHGCSNAKLYGNYFYMNAASTKPMLAWTFASDGDMRNNLLVSVNATQRILDMGSTAVSGWGAGKWSHNDYWAPGITNTTTFANIVGGGGAQRLSTFSASYAGGSELNIDPDLDADYRPPADSALIGAGTNVGVVYMGFDGPFWQAGPPTVGATELQR